MSVLEQNFWSKYGFINNPYDTNALTNYSDSILPICKAYVGRDKTSKEFQLITNILSGKGGNRVMIEGEIGVGKTTFMNYHRYVWENESSSRLFTTSGEITFSLQWNRCSFMQEIISHLTTKLYLLYGDSIPKNNDIYSELLILNKVFIEENYQWQLNVFGIGGGVGKEKQIFTPTISEAKLHYYYRSLIETILNLGYSGIILHFDNMELLLYNGINEAQKVFEEIRDILQTPYIYYVFVAKNGFFNKVITPLDRVKSVFFSWPIHIKPLSEDEVIKILDLRYELLSTSKMRYIPPVQKDMVSYLYNLYEGRIRFIMDAIHGILIHSFSPYIQTLPTTQARKLLLSLTTEKIRNVLSKRELDVLLHMANLNEFTNKELSSILKLKKQNIAKYIQKFLNSGYIVFIRKEGRCSFYQIVDEIRYLKNMMNKPYLTSKKSTPLPQKRKVSKLNKRQQNFLSQAKLKSQITTSDYLKKFDISRVTASKDLEMLLKDEYLEKFGKTKGVYYRVVKKYK